MLDGTLCNTKYQNSNAKCKQAACRDIPSAPPIALQLTSLFRNVSICICSTVRVASTVATAGCSELSS